MGIWFMVIVGAAVVGRACAKVSRRWLSLLASAAAPWLALLATLLFHDAFFADASGGAGMWQVAQLFGGTAAAVVGLTSCLFFRSRQNH
jgi:hypothetical protein